ncbi:GNAT family N-acetyltransferase [Halomarina salina]|uniref:GNAT family N-acetyltransferase n=1 Tax=Halomarina salina TaxID=1872699 RepID=A0ABD5RHT0_9EURY|nr:GNAT family N-acetyltransferase [Halomarina salina]
MDVSTISVDEWEEEVPDGGVSVFHRPETLRVVDRHVDGDLRLFVGHKGDRLVGMLPVYRREHPVGSVAVSPPPGLGIPHQGPMLLPASPKQRKRERLNRTFTEAVVDGLDDDAPFSLLRVVCLPEHADPRPFRWHGFDVATQFTYRLDLDGVTTDEVRSGFSRSLRREIDDAAEKPITVQTEGVNGARCVYEDCVERYAEQGREYSLPWRFVRDLVVELRDRAQVYVARGPDDEYLGGIVALYGDDTAYFWQGGVRHTYDGATTNSLLHWEILQDLVDHDTVEQYDLFGANTARLCEYKSKFGGRLVPYYRVESSGPGMALAKSAYSLAGRLGSVTNGGSQGRASSESD